MLSSLKSIADRTLGIARGTVRRGTRIGRRVTSDAVGLVRRVQNRRPGPKPGMDDVTLARKVESVIFRPADAPKDSVDVNVVDGIVELRGQVKRPQDKKALEAAVRSIPEVRGVENLLHLPKTPAPTRADSPGRQRRRTTKPKAAKGPARGGASDQAGEPAGRTTES